MISTSKLNMKSNDYRIINIKDIKIFMCNIISKDDHQIFIKEYYNKVLKKLDPKKMHEKFNDCILVSEEDSEELSLRHIIASWLELSLKIDIPEIKSNNDNLVAMKRPKYIKEYLYKVINEDAQHNLQKEKNIQIKFHL